MDEIKVEKDEVNEIIEWLIFKILELIVLLDNVNEEFSIVKREIELYWIENLELKLYLENIEYEICSFLDEIF